MNRTIALLLSLNLCALMAFAQGKARAHLDSIYIFIGDQVQVQLLLDSAFNATDIQTDFSVFDSIPELEVVRYSEWNPVGVNRAGGTGLYEQRIVITSFENGAHTLPAIPIRYKVNGQEQIALTNTPRIEVATIGVTDTTQLTPIKGIVEEPRTIEDFLPYLIAVAAIGLLVALFFFIRRLSRKQETPPPPPVVLKPYEIALQKLEALGAAQLWQSGSIKAYQSELTFIIREYLENQFKIPALENTTDEIITSLQQYGFAAAWQERLRILFQNADLVKFAKADPPLQIHEDGMREALAFVWETKPAEVAEN